MGNSPSAQICFGIAFAGDFNFPWGCGLDDWWRDQCGFYNPHDTATHEGRVQFYRANNQWNMANPCPVEVITCCDGDYPGGYVLALSDTVVRSWEGGPDRIAPAAMLASDEDRTFLMEFCKAYEIETNEGPGWYLSSYYG